MTYPGLQLSPSKDASDSRALQAAADLALCPSRDASEMAAEAMTDLALRLSQSKDASEIASQAIALGTSFSMDASEKASQALATLGLHSISMDASDCERAAEEMAILGFEALYQDYLEDEDETMMDEGETMMDETMIEEDETLDYSLISESSGSSTFNFEVLFGSRDEQDVETLLDGSSENGGESNEKPPIMNAAKSVAERSAAVESTANAGSVAWFHQKRIDRYNEKTRKVEIFVVTDDSKTKRVLTQPKRRKRLTNDSRPSKRQSVGKKMRGWLHGHRSVSLNSIDPTEPRIKEATFEEPKPPPPFVDPNKPPMEEIEVEAKDIGSTHRLTITVKRKRDEAEDQVGACSLFLAEFLDMGYFCRCLGEGIKEEGLRCTGFGVIDEENSVVLQEGNTGNDEDDNILSRPVDLSSTSRASF